MTKTELQKIENERKSILSEIELEQSTLKSIALELNLNEQASERDIIRKAALKSKALFTKAINAYENIRYARGLRAAYSIVTIEIAEDN